MACFAEKIGSRKTKDLFWRAGIVIMMLSQMAGADMMEGMQDGPKEFHAKNAKSKTFHWIVDLGLLLAVPSIAAVFAVANRYRFSLVLHSVLAMYLVIEVLFLRFPDNKDDHENRTSIGTAWFLTILLGVNVFVGSFINGSNLVINKFYSHLSDAGRYGITNKIYKALAVMASLTGWVRVCMAPVALFGFCYGRHTGQCIAHGIMGSAFVFYGFILALVLVVPWIRNHFHPSLNGNPNLYSQEFYDSTVMCIWGIVNTFTEHRWGREPWNHGDYQHTSMGIVWWCGGLLGMWLTRKGNTRSFIPALLLMFTGYAMSEHAQRSQISTKVHAFFGMVLIGGGVCRIVEILLVLLDKCTSSLGKILSFQHIPPLALVLAGVLFMSANEEQLQLVQDLGADHSSYILVVSGAGFMIYLFMLLLLHLYLRLVGYDEDGPLLPSTEGIYENIDQNGVAEFELDNLSDLGDDQVQDQRDIVHP